MELNKMEKQLYHNINLIIDSIDNQAAKEKETLENAAEKLYGEKLALLEEEIASKYDALTKYELQKLSVDANVKANDLETAYKSKLAEMREGIIDEVFDSAIKSIESFTESESYAELIEKSAENIASLYDGAVRVYLRECDSRFENVISAKFGTKPEFVTDDKIKIGGIKVLFIDHAVLADDTLDSRLEQKRNDFIKNGDLGFKS